MALIHKEGHRLLILAFVFFLAAGILAYVFLPAVLAYLLIAGLIIFYGLILQFFRNPARPIPQTDDSMVYAPADGEVVVIEEVEEGEYFQDRRVQISIFMSPLNVHVNRTPFSGEVKYSKYHPGKYLVAWHPKSSTENERTTVVFNNGQHDVLLRQIAGAVARRICNYAKVGERYVQGQDFGFIKFGSRVDVFLPLDADIKVTIGQAVKGNTDVLAILP